MKLAKSRLGWVVLIAVLILLMWALAKFNTPAADDPDGCGG